MFGLTLLDIVTLLLVGGGLLFGFFQGFVCEVLSLFAWVAAVVALRLFHTPFTHWLERFIHSQTGCAVLAFALLFGGALVLGKLIAARLGRATRQSVVGPVDRVLGGGFGALKGLIGMTLLFLAANLGYDVIYGKLAPRPNWMANARSYPLLQASSRAIVDFVQAQRDSGTHDQNKLEAAPEKRT